MPFVFKLQVDDTALFDYSLFFISCLAAYYQATNDRDCLIALWETAYRQTELAMQRVNKQGVVEDSDDWWCFLDWHPKLNKQAGAQGVLIYTLKKALILAETLNDRLRTQQIKAWIDRKLLSYICGIIRKDFLLVVKLVKYPGHHRYGLFWQMFSQWQKINKFYGN